MLWVLTQDKRSLVNMKEVSVKEKTVEGIISMSFFVYWSRVLGEYDSQERALEVVIQIYKKLEDEENGSAAFSMPDKQNSIIFCRAY